MEAFVHAAMLLKSGEMSKQVLLCLLLKDVFKIPHPWSSLVEGGEGSYLPNCKTNFVIALYTLSLLLFKFINTTAYHLGRFKPSSPVSCHAPRLIWKIQIGRAIWSSKHSDILDDSLRYTILRKLPIWGRITVPTTGRQFD